MLYVIGRVVLARDYTTGVACNWNGCVSSGLPYRCCMLLVGLCWLGITLLVLYVIGRVVLARDYPTGVVCNWKGYVDSRLPYW